MGNTDNYPFMLARLCGGGVMIEELTAIVVGGVSIHDLIAPTEPGARDHLASQIADEVVVA